MTAPLDLDAIRAKVILQRGINDYDLENLLAEVERLRADSVPRSALVQVGWTCGHHKMPDYGDTCPAHLDRECQPVYVIQEDTDASTVPSGTLQAMREYKAEHPGEWPKVEDTDA